MALAQQPKILLLDEPTTFLDIHHQLEIMELIRSLHDKLGITVVTVLHDLNHAVRYSHRVIAIKDGGSVFIGGLKQNVLKESEKRVPVLSKIPILGALFKYKRKNKEIRDIYIEITGEIQYE